MAKGLLDRLEKTAVVLPEETVHVEHWDCDVTLRGLTSRERDLFEEESMRIAARRKSNGTASQQQVVEANLENFRARLVSRHIVEDGMRTFANARGERLLGEQPAKVLDVLFTVAQQLSGFSRQDVEELTKNFEETPENGPSTNSLGSPGDQSVN